MGETTVILPATFDPCGHETPQADLDALAELVRSIPPPVPFRSGPVCLEVGSWSGSSALAMLAAGASKVHCVDTWQGTKDVPGPLVFDAFVTNVGVKALGRTIFPHRMTSLEAAGRHFGPLDLVFIDADHSYEACLADIRAWTPHVRQAGIICGHDITLGGVEQAVKETGAYERAGWSMWWRRV